MKPRTYHQGARDERRDIKAKIKRELKGAVNSQVRFVLAGLAAWIDQRNERYEKRPGGLGRKKAK